MSHILFFILVVRKSFKRFELFGKMGKNIDNTKAVLKDYGNMSSATVLFVLEKFMSEPQDKDSIGMMLSFGPGFTAQNLLLKW